jgi:hypothetical protein
LNIIVRQLLQLFTSGVLEPALYRDVITQASAALANVLKAGAKMLRVIARMTVAGSVLRRPA